MLCVSESKQTGGPLRGRERTTRPSIHSPQSSAVGCAFRTFAGHVLYICGAYRRGSWKSLGCHEGGCWIKMCSWM